MVHVCGFPAKRLPTGGRPVQRTGPVVVLDCFRCEGVGRPGCPTCKGTGRVGGDVHPFTTLEALAEHLGALRLALGISAPQGDRPTPGDPAAYHLWAADVAAMSLVQQLILLLPEEWVRTEGPDAAPLFAEGADG